MVKYDPLVKHEVMMRMKNGESPTVRSRCFGIARSTVYRWKNESTAISVNEKLYTKNDVTILERRIKKTESIIQILKTVNCTIHSPLRERLNELEKLNGEYDVHTLCEALDVSRGTYYNHICRNKRDNAWYKKREEEYRILIHDIFYEFDQILGAKKIHAILQQRGHSVSEKYVARIMLDLGLSSIRTDAKRLYIAQRKKPSNILQQDFTSHAPDKIWISDVTCFKIRNNWLYIW